MLSIDWLECFCMTDNAISAEPPVSCFMWKERPFGSKMWEHIFEVTYLIDGQEPAPFAVVCTHLRGKIEQPCAASVKIANEQLYKVELWTRFMQFRCLYGITIKNISRVDLAADFIYLRGRISGRQLVKNIKELRWWKCGSVNCSEHYSLPYSIKWAANPDTMEQTLYAQSGRAELRTESLTFGTKSSFAQVCIYDKTLELSSHEVDGVAQKEYIRDAWKQAGCYDPTRHTWRIEIRLNSKAMTVADQYASGGLRAVQLADLYPDQLPQTFQAASDVWFRLVDASKGDPDFCPDSQFCQSMRKRKNEFQVVRLFPAIDCHIRFSSRPHQSQASKFINAMIKRLDSTADQFDNQELPARRKSDPHFLREAAQVMRSIFAAEVAKERKEARTDYFVQLYRELKDEIYYRKLRERDEMELSTKELSLLAWLTSPAGPLTPMQIYEVDHDGEIIFEDLLTDEQCHVIAALQQSPARIRIVEKDMNPSRDPDQMPDFNEYQYFNSLTSNLNNFDYADD